ncbi:unnamed protein product [Lathyrus sativus]|nr:unnamed protein product [Lathyrus sativus]
MAPPNPKVKAAFRAMTNLGIHESKVKPVLKLELVKLYEGNWELIEADNYTALVDAIFDVEDNLQEDNQVYPISCINTYLFYLWVYSMKFTLISHAQCLVIVII